MFSPSDFKPVTNTELSTLIASLDKDFADAVAKGYYTEMFQDKIQLIYGQGIREEYRTYTDLLALRKEVEAHYLSLGWSDVLVMTSEENGERPGLISITLIKGAVETKTSVDYPTLIRKELSDIRACLKQMPIQRSAHAAFEILGISLENLGKIADAMEK